jgi:hypothetical protein
VRVNLNANVNALVLSLVVAACGGGSEPPPKFPPQPPGCPVQVYKDAPTVQTENLGPVIASCTPDIPADACERTLKDQACKLGGDVVWGVARMDESGRYRLVGRAAHTIAK